MNKTKKDKYRTAILIQVTNTSFVRAKIRDFANWSLNGEWLLNTGPLHTGST